MQPYNKLVTIDLTALTKQLQVHDVKLIAFKQKIFYAAKRTKKSVWPVRPNPLRVLKRVAMPD